MRRSAEDEFHAFVVARTPALSRTAFLLTGDAHLAEDLVQTALFQAARHWHRIEGDPEPYVRRILYTENISRWRRQRRVVEVSTEGYDQADRSDDDVDLHIVLARALDRLTEKQRTVLVLRYFEDLTEVRTAAELGISSGAVKSMSRQALQRLRVLAPELADLVGADA